jgi:tripartite ATP-independent transporter DctP family solute receptor
MKTNKPSRSWLCRRLFLATAFGALLAPFGATVGEAAAAKVLRISTPGVPEETQSKSLIVFKTALEQLAPGQFDTQIHLNGTLFAQGTEIPAMQRGNLEMALVSAQDISKQIPEYTIFTAGYLIRDPDHQQSVFGGEIGREVYGRVAKDMNVQILGIQYLGTRQLNLREQRDVKTPADMAGVKLRMPGSKSWQFLGRALGASPTPMDFNEVYLGLQTGTVDGQDNPLPVVVEAKFYEVTKQIVLTSHLVDGVFIAIAKAYWDGLTAEQRNAIQTAADTAIAFNNTANLVAEQSVQDFLKSKGLTISMPDRDAFRNAVQKAYLESEYSKTWQPGLLDRINAVK